MCQKSTLNPEQVSKDVVVATCVNCEAKFKVDTAGEGSITMLALGKDPRNTGAKFEELSVKTTLQFWREFDKIDNEIKQPKAEPEETFTCDRCGVELTPLGSIDFRTGNTSSQREFFLNLFFPELMQGSLNTDMISIARARTYMTSMELTTLNRYVCPKCHRIEFHMPRQRPPSSVSRSS
jgi:Zn finger protein HypA/HybF involved in hydrogenase expression